MDSLNNTSKPSGRKWKHIFDHQDWVQNLHRKNKITLITIFQLTNNNQIMLDSHIVHCSFISKYILISFMWYICKYIYICIYGFYMLFRVRLMISICTSFFVLALLHEIHDSTFLPPELLVLLTEPI